jgi:hypothetical protein
MIQNYRCVSYAAGASSSRQAYHCAGWSEPTVISLLPDSVTNISQENL